MYLPRHFQETRVVALSQLLGYFFGHLPNVTYVSKSK
jgi:hypothetical protein